jgi:hypothetical protein
MQRIRGKADGRVGCRRISAMPMDGRELDGLGLDERDLDERDLDSARGVAKIDFMYMNH